MRTSWLAWAAVVVGGVTVDQLSKRWAELHVRGRGIITLVDGVLELRYTHNRGAFFSMGADLQEDLRRGFFIAAGLAALLLIANIYRKTEPAQRRLRCALSLLSAGAVGNLVDRVRRGEVVDFLHLRAGDAFHWATFNMADVYIAVGLGLLLLDLARPHWRAPLSPRPNGGT